MKFEKKENKIRNNIRQRLLKLQGKLSGDESIQVNYHDSTCCYANRLYIDKDTMYVKRDNSWEQLEASRHISVRGIDKVVEALSGFIASLDAKKHVLRKAEVKGVLLSIRRVRHR